MILTCPECATRYFVDDAKLGAEGRTVRCAGCGNSWRAKAEPTLELTLSPEEGAIAASVPATEAAKPQPLPKAFRAKAVEKKSMRAAMVHGIVWAGMAAVVAALFGAAALFRVDVVRFIPRAAGAYAMVGMPVNATGLVFERISAKPSLQDGHSALVVSGQIRNDVDREVSAPPIRIHVLDSHGKPVLAKTLPSEKARLKPGEVRHFVVSLLDPPATAHDVEVAFLLGANSHAPVSKGHAAPATSDDHDKDAPPPLRGPAHDDEPHEAPAPAEPAPAEPAVPKAAPAPHAAPDAEPAHH